MTPQNDLEPRDLNSSAPVVPATLGTGVRMHAERAMRGVWCRIRMFAARRRIRGS